MHKCSPISATDDPKVFSRNPAVVMWDFYRNIEGYAIADLDVNEFKSLEALCAVYPAGDGSQCRPPGPTASTVKATSTRSATKYSARYATDITRAIDGGGTRTQWLSYGSTTNQSFNVDMGVAGILTKVTLINAHADGTKTDKGIDDLRYGDQMNQVRLTIRLMRPIPTGPQYLPL